MSLISVEQLRSLVEQAQKPCLSLYMPMERAGAETRQNSIRFKNMIRQAEAQLQANGLRSTEIQNFLQPVLELDQENFWQHQDIGLAIFATPGLLQYYRLPVEFDELIVVNDQFHLKPLMPFLTNDGKFYILAISQRQIRLLECTKYNVKAIDLPNVPQSVDEALQYDPTAKEGQHRIGLSVGGGGLGGQNMPGSFHGQGSPDRDHRKGDILQFFHVVDQRLHEILNDQRSPMVLVGVEYLFPLYQGANSYPYLLEEGITENPEIYKPEELHAKVLPLIEPHFNEKRQAAIEQYKELAGTGKTSTQIQEIVPAAYYGRVGELFVAVGVQQWGRFDPQSNQLELHPEAMPGDEDLLNSAAVQTALNGGTVYAVSPEQVPETENLVAVFRY